MKPSMMYIMQLGIEHQTSFYQLEKYIEYAFALNPCQLEHEMFQ